MSACNATAPRLRPHDRWGQDGPLAQAAGHDLNYIALSGALWYSAKLARRRWPAYVGGDMGGGALYLALGVLAGILHARSCAMVRS